MHLWPELAHMPPLSHWPNRSIPFSPETSEVLAWIGLEYQCDLHVADKIFEAARHKRVITFNPNSRLWCGTKGGRP